MDRSDTKSSIESPADVLPYSAIRSANKKASKSLNIAMVGQKGLPATYGGVEHHVGDLSARLARMGHKVTVYCRRYYSGDLTLHPHVLRDLSGGFVYDGVGLKMAKSIKTKHLDAISHAAISTLLSGKKKFDIVHFHGIGPSFMSFIPVLRGQRCVATVHGLDYRQKKWGFLARQCLKIGLKSALTFPDRTICVSRAIQRDLGNPTSTVVIPNGVKDPRKWGKEEIAWMADNGLNPNGYILFVGRLIEDKGCHLLCRAIKEMNNGMKVAIAGSSSFTDDYVQRLKNIAGPESVFLGSIYDSKLSALFQNAALFVLPSSVEGLPIVMLEAMKHGTPVLASDIPENMEILDGAGTGNNVGLSFKDKDIESLKSSINYALSNTDLINAMAEQAKIYVDSNYSMDIIAGRTDEVYQDLFS